MTVEYILWDNMVPVRFIESNIETRTHIFPHSSVQVIAYRTRISGEFLGEAYHAGKPIPGQTIQTSQLGALNLWLRDIAELGTDLGDAYEERPER